MLELGAFVIFAVGVVAWWWGWRQVRQDPHFWGRRRRK